MSTPNLSHGNPPDYIAIPEHLRTKPVPKVAKRRLERLLERASIRLLGNLHGRRLSDFEAYPGCGHLTVLDLRDMVIQALYPGAQPDLEAWPTPMRYYKAHPSLEVSAAIGHLRLQDLPVSVRLDNALEGTGIERLGHLHGWPIRALMARRSFGVTSLAELTALLRRAEAGEFTHSEPELASQTPADLLWLIDDLVSRLPRRWRALLALYFGAGGAAPQTASQISKQSGVGTIVIRCQLRNAIRRIRDQGNPRLLTLLDWVDGNCASSQTPLSPPLVSTWQESARPFRYSPEFYVRLIAGLRSESGIEGAEREAPAQSDAEGA